MQLPGNFLVTLEDSEMKLVLIKRLKKFIAEYLSKEDAFTPSSFDVILDLLIIWPRLGKSEKAKIFWELVNEGAIENVPENSFWFRLKD